MDSQDTRERRATRTEGPPAGEEPAAGASAGDTADTSTRQDSAETPNPRKEGAPGSAGSDAPQPQPAGSGTPPGRNAREASGSESPGSDEPPGRDAREETATEGADPDADPARESRGSREEPGSGAAAGAPSPSRVPEPAGPRQPGEADAPAPGVPAAAAVAAPEAEERPRGGAGRRVDRPRLESKGAPTDLPATGKDPEARGRTPEGKRIRKGVLDVRSPLDGSELGTVAICSPVEVLEAVERARSVQQRWIDMEADERVSILSKLTAEIGERADEIADVVRRETGKPRVEAMTEVLVTLDLLRYYEEVAPRILRRQWVKTNWLIGKSAYTYREPYGVVGAITPWNYPFIIVMDSVAAALFAGNSVVVKPSEFTPHTALKIEELCRDAGLPDGLVEVVPGDHVTGEALVGSGVDKILFTGSSRTGRLIMAKAAENLTPVALELGGKDPAIVLDDADLERTARGVVFGSFFNAGQTCLSTERVFVMDAVYDDFVDEVTSLVEGLRAGTEGEYDVGPMTTRRQLDVVEEQVDDALARGARIVVGGKRKEEGSNVFLPTVLVDVDQSMKVMWEETFGPILPIARIHSEDEAVRMANVTPFGLFASVWTEDRERGERLGERLRAGGVSVNDTLSHYAVPGLPVGGVGESGFGRRRGVAGLEELSRPRSVLIHRTGLGKELWWYPYSERGRRLVSALLEYRQSSGLKRIWNGIRGFFRRRPR